MATEFFSEIDVQVAYSPLTLTYGIAAETAVGTMQMYDMSSGEYVPDWTVAHPVLRPWLDVQDSDGFIPSGTKTYANPKWTAIEDGKERAITASDNDYSIILSGDDMGVLAVKRNASPGKPLTLRFEGEYADTRTGEVRRVVMSHTLVCEGVAALPQLTIDQPETVWYYPLRADSNELTVNAELKIGDTEVDAANRIFVWERLRDTGAWTEVGSTLADYDITVSADGTQAKVRLDLMGQRLDLRVRARYDAYGNPSGVALNAGSPSAAFSAIRRLMPGRVTVTGPGRILPSMRYVEYEAHMSDGKGIIPDAGSLFAFSWYTAKGMADGSVTYGSPVATGQKARIPVSAFSSDFGGKVQVGVSDLGWLKALTVDGAYLTVDGKILVVK